MSKFFVWITDSNATNACQTPDVFSADSQRQTGFIAGTAASAVRVNTALRQANLISVALLDAFGINETDNRTLSVQSTLSQLKDAIKASNLCKLSSNIEAVSNELRVSTTLRPMLEGLSLGTLSWPFNSIYASRFYGVLEGNVIGRCNDIDFEFSNSTGAISFNASSDVGRTYDISSSTFIYESGLTPASPGDIIHLNRQVRTNDKLSVLVEMSYTGSDSGFGKCSGYLEFVGRLSSSNGIFCDLLTYDIDGHKLYLRTYAGDGAAAEWSMATKSNTTYYLRSIKKIVD